MGNSASAIFYTRLEKQRNIHDTAFFQNEWRSNPFGNYRTESNYIDIGHLNDEVSILCDNMRTLCQT